MQNDYHCESEKHSNNSPFATVYINDSLWDEKDAVLVTVADHRLTCHGFLAKINEPIVARICHDQSYAD